MVVSKNGNGKCMGPLTNVSISVMENHLLPKSILWHLIKANSSSVNIPVVSSWELSDL